MATKIEGKAEVTGTGTVGVAGLDIHGLEPRKAVHWNLSPVQLYERALERAKVGSPTWVPSLRSPVLIRGGPLATRSS